MKRASYAAAAVLSLGLAACGDYDRNEAAYNNDSAAYAEGDANYSAEGANYSAGGATGATASTTWPSGSRIVVENGVTYRIEPGGARIRLGENDSRIVIDNGIRYRVDPGGARVRIDPTGAVIDTGAVETRIDDDGDASVTVNTD